MIPEARASAVGGRRYRANMDDMRLAGVILAALELAPAKPSDVTALLLNTVDRQTLLGREEDNERTRHKHSTASPLARYLAAQIDPGRIDYWAKVVDNGVDEGRYHPVPVTNPNYPLRLREACDAPPLLFCSGGAHSPRNVCEATGLRPSLAIVGSREANRQVAEVTERTASELAAAGVTIVSGLAAGVDAAAHRGALGAFGYTVAVMGTGIDTIFPESNLDLAAEIGLVGALVSQFAPSAPRTRSSFLLRNHVIAAMSDASLIMDGADRSGSRHEVERAIHYGRPVLAWAPTLGHRRWVTDLVNAGSIHLVESAAEVHEHLAPCKREGGA